MLNYQRVYKPCQDHGICQKPFYVEYVQQHRTGRTGIASYELVEPTTPLPTTLWKSGTVFPWYGRCNGRCEESARREQGPFWYDFLSKLNHFYS